MSNQDDPIVVLELEPELVVSQEEIPPEPVVELPGSGLHDERYYTESEVDQFLSQKSDMGHDHAGEYQPAMGSDDNYVTDAEKANLHAPGSDNQVIPTKLSDLSDDATHRLVTDTEKGVWDGKQPAMGSDDNYVTDAEKANLHAPGSDNQVIPTKLSDLSDDATHRLVTDTEKGAWNGKSDLTLAQVKQDTDVADAISKKHSIGDMANMAADTIKGRQTNSTGSPEDIALAEQTLFGRVAGGHVDDLTVPQIKSLMFIINKGFYDPTSALPSNPSTGDRYIATATANGWTTQYIYTWNGSAWLETVPVSGSPYSVYLSTYDWGQYVFNGSEWFVIGKALCALGTLTNGNTYYLNLQLYTDFTASVANSASVALNFSGTYRSGHKYRGSLKIAFGTSPTIAYDAKTKWAGSSAPAPTASGTDEYIFENDDGGTLYPAFVAGQDCK